MRVWRRGGRAVKSWPVPVAMGSIPNQVFLNEHHGMEVGTDP